MPQLPQLDAPHHADIIATRSCPKCSKPIVRLVAHQRRTELVELSCDGIARTTANVSFEPPERFCCPHCLALVAKSKAEALNFLNHHGSTVRLLPTQVIHPLSMADVAHRVIGADDRRTLP
jgi:hypothetical protein